MKPLSPRVARKNCERMVVYKLLELLEILIGMQMKASIFCSGQTEDFQVKQNFGGHLSKISNTNFNRKMLHHLILSTTSAGLFCKELWTMGDSEL